MIFETLGWRIDGVGSSFDDRYGGVWDWDLLLSGKEFGQRDVGVVIVDGILAKN